MCYVTVVYVSISFVNLESGGRNVDFGLSSFTGFPGVSDGKESTCNARDLGSIPGLGRFPGEGNGNPFQYSYLQNPHGQRSLVGDSPWGHKESRHD